MKKPVAIITDLEVEEVSLVANPANKPSRVTLWKSAPKEPSVPKTEKAAQECRICTQAVDGEDKYCRGCGAPFYKSENEEPKMTESTDPKAATTEDIAKSREATEKAMAEELAKRDEALAKANAELSALRRERIVSAKCQHVEKSMAAVGAPAEELAEKLVALAEKDAELAKYFEALLVKASEVMAKSALFGAVTEPTAQAVGDIEKKVDAMVAAKMAEDKTLTKAKAEARVWHENPGLYKDYLAR